MSDNPRADLIGKAEIILVRAEKENRGLTDGERADYQKYMSQLADLDASIGKPVSMGSGIIGLSDREARSYSLVKAIRAASEGRLEQDAGLEFAASKAAEKQLGRAPRGFWIPEDIVTHQTRTTGGATMLQGTTNYGGDVVATDLLGGSLIEMLMNRLVVRRLGATTLTGLVGNIAIPAVTNTPTAAWVIEDTDLTISRAEFAQKTAYPHTLGAAVDVSRRLILQSGIDIENFVRNEIVRSLAVELDASSLHGTGTNEPFGISTTTGINLSPMSSSTNANAVATLTNLMAFISAVATDNADTGRLGWAINPATLGYLMSNVKHATAAAGMLMESPNELLGFPVVVSNQVRSDLNVKASGASEIFYGNFAELVICSWSGWDALINPFSLSLSGSVRVIVRTEADFIVRHAPSFCYASDVDFA